MSKIPFYSCGLSEGDAAPKERAGSRVVACKSRTKSRSWPYTSCHGSSIRPVYALVPLTDTFAVTMNTVSFVKVSSNDLQAARLYRQRPP